MQVIWYTIREMDIHSNTQYTTKTYLTNIFKHLLQILISRYQF